MQRFRVAVSAVVLAAVLALSACEHASVAFYSGVTFGPPPPRVFGPVGVAPGPGWVWTDGYYDWAGGGWVWRPGRWVRPPHPGYVWRPPRYQRYGNGYRVYRGHWERR